MGKKLNSKGSWKQWLSKYVGGGSVKESNCVGGEVEKSAVFRPHFFLLEQP